jgi:hypothetical protein
MKSYILIALDQQPNATTYSYVLLAPTNYCDSASYEYIIASWEFYPLRPSTMHLT